MGHFAGMRQWKTILDRMNPQFFLRWYRSDASGTKSRALHAYIELQCLWFGEEQASQEKGTSGEDKAENME